MSRPPSRQAVGDALYERLIPWFRGAHRDLPWRRTRDPYRIWVSEIMLQQTRVDTVIPYYEAFLARFPTLNALAASPLEAVLKAWEGMGYYARARNLHRAARQLVEQGRSVPHDLDGMRALPGVGRYTAGAILSIARGLPLPALDGNVRRVLARVFGDDGDAKDPATLARLWEHAAALMRPDDPSAHNQALMELGATMCTPVAPECGACPLEGVCRARALERPEDYPARAGARPTPHHEMAVGVVRDGRGRFLIARRPLRGLLGGLWDLPGGRRRDGESLEDACSREAGLEHGLEVRVDAPLVTVRHAYTHFKVTMHAFLCTRLHGRLRAGDARRWIHLHEADGYAFPAACHRILDALRGR